jgi:hypothetical protein
MRPELVQLRPPGGSAVFRGAIRADLTRSSTRPKSWARRFASRITIFRRSRCPPALPDGDAGTPMRVSLFSLDAAGGCIRHRDLAAQVAPEVMRRPCPHETGRRESRVPMTPAVVRTRCTRRTAGAPEHPAFPAQWFYGLWRALPGDEFLLPPSLTDWRSIEARSGPTISISLTPATGARTTRFYRPQLPRAIRLDRPACCRKKFRPRRLSAVRLRAVRSLTGIRPATTRASDAAASTATCPNLRDDGQRPSSRDRMAGVVSLIWVPR